MEIEKDISPDFWRWYFNNKLSGFREVSRHDRVLNNCKNIFNEHQPHNLTINLLQNECIDGNDYDYPILHFIAKYRDQSTEEARDHVEVELARWREREKVRKEHMKFRRDEDNLRWKKKTGEDSYEEVTDYDIAINSIVESYDLKVDEWNRKFDCTLRYFNKDGKLITEDIELSPEQTHSFNNFSNAIWEKETRITQNLTNHDMRKFWAELERYYEPRIVREFKHYGFIEFEKETFFLAENVLIKFPENSNDSLILTAKDEGAYKVKENKYIKPSDDPMHLPHFDLGPSQDGQYKAAMNRLFDDQMFEKKLKKEVISEFCSMVGGDSEFRQWGKLIVGYIFSYIFFDDIYDLFKHVIFLYFYGEGNVGKGEVVKRILDFYGISYQDSLQTPPPRSVDEAIEEKSQVPLWVDEHVPQVPGQDHKIEDQEWNSWFELKMRRTNIKKGKSYGLERKAVRTMPVFCSNFRPRTDHLQSRCLILEYKRNRRGPEKHVRNLKNNKQLRQRLMLSYMEKYKLLNREAFVWDLDRIRNKLKKDVREELSNRSGEAILQDRQISQFAALITVYHWLFKEYREEIELLHQDSKEAENESDEVYRKNLKEKLRMNLSDITFDSDLYQFVKQQTTKSAVTAAQYNPFTNYVQTINTLIESNEVNSNHFNWMSDGTLKIWAKAVWDKYLEAKRGTDEIVRREAVYQKFKELSLLDEEGGLKTITWTPSHREDPVNCKGFYIPNANENELLRMGFQLHKYGPSSAQIRSEEKLDNDQKNYEDETDKQLEFDKDIPF